MKNKTGGFSGAGISSLIIVFTVLALAIFTLLTLITVRQDLELSRKTSAVQAEYYKADTEATERLGKLYALAEENDSSALLAFAAGNDGFTTGIDGDTVTFSWSAEIGSTARLECEAVYDGGQITVTKWHTVSNASYTNEDSLPIWDGSTLPI
ncbi:MAG: hypothetical protein J1E39_08150 [Eubacterium sp.]|nr:hypothetical protein [Eubacterium sp.]